MSEGKADAAQTASILLVDDRPENLLALEETLAPLGHRLTSATSGDRALRLLLNGDFAVILLDVQMPGIDGFELADLIRARERSRRTPIIFLTAGSSHHQQIVRGYEAGGVDYLLKPYDPDVLRAKVSVFVELARARSELAYLAGLNRAVLDATAESIEVVGPSGDPLLANAAHERLREELGGAVPGPPATGDDPLAVAEDEVEHYAGRWFRRRTAPVLDDRGRQIGRMTVLRDVTVERAAEQLKTSLVETVSHELRNPLTAVLGFAEMARRPGLDEATRERWLETVIEQAQRMNALVDDFLDLQRIEHSAFRLLLEPFELYPVLEREAALFSVQSEIHRIALAVEHELPGVVGERDRIEQVVANLLSNAIKYSPAGGEVELAARTRDGWVRVSVRDEGLGIPAEQQAKLFTKFFRVDTPKTRSIGGRGSGWRCHGTSSRRTAASSASRASRAKARPSGSSCPAPPDGSCEDAVMPRGYMEGPAADEAERRLDELERGVEQPTEERLAVFGSTADDPEKHFIGWRDDVDPDELFASGAAWALSVRRTPHVR